MAFTSGGEASEFGGGAEPICSADLHPPLPPEAVP